MRTILTTVGTSLLGNSSRNNISRDEASLVRFIAQNPQDASAESNSLSRLLEKGDEVVLIHSHTSEGETCAKVLLSYLNGIGFEAQIHVVPQLQYDQDVFARLGLRNLVQTLAREIRKARHKDSEVIINATGGFKAEIAYATAVGLLFKIPVCYIHDRFEDIVTLPATPIGWDPTLISENEEFFDWIEEEPRTRREVQSRLHQLPQSVQMLLEDDNDGNTYLSAMGEAYREAFRLRLEETAETPLYFSKRAMRDWKKLEPSQQELFKRQFKRLRVPEIRSRVVELVPPSDALIFPQGRVDERLFFTEKEGEIYILELTCHGDNYDSLIKRGVRWRDYQDDGFKVVKSV